jgi:sigma-54 dependent transcriptional regulator, acetoin dehydrogenase operon transcriptional activator AcoR
MYSYIEASHKRSKEIGINDSAAYSMRIMNEKQLQERIEENEELILSADPYISHLYSFVKGTNFFAILTDCEGCILSVLGDEEILSEAYKLKMVPGAFMDETNIGTNAMSLALSEKRPVQVSGTEHFISAYHKWTCSAAPIKNSEGKIIGVIDLTGYCESVHPHTLGMVVAAANAIERIMEAKKLNSVIELSQKNTNAFESKNKEELPVFHETNKNRKLAGRILNGKAIYTFDKIISQNERFKSIIEYAKKIADSKSTVLITGESGTGKEIFAQSIHNYSMRREEPFVAVNCGAIPRTLIESELFGYEEGAFTGAKKGGNMGKFELAEGGTIFLDEIGEMPTDMQIKLLRVIEEGVINRIGSSKQQPLNVRIIAATNKDLKIEIQKETFRKDLYYRLNVLPVFLTPLRERREDIPLLVDYYMKKTSRKLNREPVNITVEYMDYLQSHDWPGNIRELENVIELVVNTGAIEVNQWNNEFKQSKPLNIKAHLQSLEAIEKIHIINILNEVEGNISIAAKILDIGRNTLYRKLQKYEIDCSKIELCSKMEQA